jgi:hypothetical protein
MAIDSYKPPEGNIFEKRLYNWHSIPIRTLFPLLAEFSLPFKAYF